MPIFRYQAPERLLGVQTSALEMDMWSVGCVLAELLLRKPVFGAEDDTCITFETDLRPAEDDAERMVAFAMGLHERLG